MKAFLVLSIGLSALASLVSGEVPIEKTVTRRSDPTEDWNRYYSNYNGRVSTGSSQGGASGNQDRYSDPPRSGTPPPYSSGSSVPSYHTGGSQVQGTVNPNQAQLPDPGLVMCFSQPPTGAQSPPLDSRLTTQCRAAGEGGCTCGNMWGVAPDCTGPMAGTCRTNCQCIAPQASSARSSEEAASQTQAQESRNAAQRGAGQRIRAWASRVFRTGGRRNRFMSV